MSVVPECSAELDLYENRYINDAVVNRFLEPKHPISIISTNNSNPIEFFIDGNDKAIRPRSCFILLQAKLNGQVTTPASGGTAAAQHDAFNAAANCYPINNIAHALFTKVVVSFNGQETSNVPHYEYSSYFNTRFGSTSQVLDSTAQAHGWYEDDTDGLDASTSVGNTTLMKRKTGVVDPNDGTINLVLVPFAAFFHMDKIIIPRLPIKISLERKANPSFYLMHSTPVAADRTMSIEITSATLYVERLELTSEFIIGLEKMLMEEDEPIVYQLVEPQILTFNVPAQQRNFAINNLFNGTVPDRILVGLVTATAFNGSPNHNPYNFQTFGVSRIGLYKDGIPFPSPPISINYTRNNYVMAYRNTVVSLNATSPIGPNITKEQFLKGTTIYAFDTTKDPSGGQDIHNHINSSTTMRLEIDFDIATNPELVCIVYFEREKRVGVDGLRNISVETIF